MFIVSNRARHSLCFRSKASIQLEKERQLNLPYFVIHPYSPFRYFWEIWMTLVYLVAFLFIPFEACNIFYTKINKNNFVNYGIPVVIVHALFMVDIIVTFFTGYVEPLRKRICLQRKKIALRYIKSYLFFDLLSTSLALINAIPLYFINGKALVPSMIILNMIKLVRIITMVEYCRKIACRFGFYGIPYKVIRFLMLSLFFFHWIACLIFIFPFIFSNVTTYSYNSWIHTIHSDLSECPIGKFYLSSLFTAINLALTCAASTRAETMSDFFTTIFYASLGMLYNCFLFIQILDIVRTIMEPETKYDEFVTQLRDYMRHNQLPANIQQRMYLFYENRYQRTYFREEAIKNTLSFHLSRDIKHFGVYKMMSKVKVFHQLDPQILEEIVDEFTVKIYLPKDMIVKSRTLNRFVYFINYGTVAVYTASGAEVKHLYDGDYFGIESSLMKDLKSNASLISIDISEVYLLEGDLFKKALMTNPETYNNVLETSKNRIKTIKAAEAMYRQTYDYPSKPSEMTIN